VTPQDFASWPAYRSHKVVRAVQITRLVPHPVTPPMPVVANLGKGPEPHRLYFMPGNDPAGLAEEFYDAPATMFARYMPKVGDYLVAYDDGYLSISPKQPFEAGYRDAARQKLAAVIHSGGGVDPMRFVRIGVGAPGGAARWVGSGPSADEAVCDLVNNVLTEPVP
jgi:hypothetical protein